MKRPFTIGRILAVTAALVVVGGGIAWYRGHRQAIEAHRPSNSIMVIAPYRHAGTWVFDDSAVGLHREPFMAGIPEMIDDMVRDIPNAENGFRLLFSPEPFPGYSHKLTWRRGGRMGNWYYCEEYQKEGWLCPALFKYFDDAPNEIYVKAEKE